MAATEAMAPSWMVGFAGELDLQAVRAAGWGNTFEPTTIPTRSTLCRTSRAWEGSRRCTRACSRVAAMEAAERPVAAAAPAARAVVKAGWRVARMATLAVEAMAVG